MSTKPLRRRFLLAVCFALGLSLIPAVRWEVLRGAELPARLSDQAFWQFIVDSSEPNGYFRSDTFTSNELWFQYVIPDLVSRTRPGGVYLGVGPEQNFTYIAAVRPVMAIIFDIRRGNMMVQLMYKAIFELAKDRADLVSMLFSKARPAGLGSESSVAELFSSFGAVETSAALFERNLRTIQDHLTVTDHLPLSSQDLDGIEYAYHAFYANGFAVRRQPTYADLMTETDRAGVSRSYLATEASFAFLKTLESKNLVIPVVGDFGGPKALRAVGAYLKAHGATVAAFYLSNVEQYLYQGGEWSAFCRNVSTLPLDAASTFIRSSSRGAGGFLSSLGAMAAEVNTCGRF